MRIAVAAPVVVVWGMLAGLGVSSSLSAQSSSGSTDNSAPICMERVTDAGRRTAAMVPASDASAMRAKGFEPMPCETDFGSSGQREAYRDSVCQIASFWEEGQQSQFEKMNGERPAVLCGMAELAIGQWRRGRK